MPNYHWKDYEKYPWKERYPDNIDGYSLWRNSETLEPMLAGVIRARHEKLRTLLYFQSAAGRPCVFISHRQLDVLQAERIAYLACKAGFGYWLDIYDPLLVGLTSGGSAKSKSHALVIATIIELALLNSTHVIVVKTPNTPGSEWVPYEYGRVKDPVPDSTRAACWVDKSLKKISGEYLLLGRIHRSEAGIKKWFRTELARLGVTTPIPGVWKRPKTTPL